MLLLFETSRGYLSILIFDQKHKAILCNVLSLQFTNCPNFVRLVIKGTFFNSKKKRFVRMSEIIPVLPLKFPFEPAENARPLCENTKGRPNLSDAYIKLFMQFASAWKHITRRESATGCVTLLIQFLELLAKLLNKVANHKNYNFLKLWFV